MENAISFLFFFYDHSMECLLAINLYGQFMTLMLFCILYGHPMIFMFFFRKIFSRNNFQLLIHIVPSNSKFLKASKPKRNNRQQGTLYDFNVFIDDHI